MIGARERGMAKRKTFLAWQRGDHHREQRLDGEALDEASWLEEIETGKSIFRLDFTRFEGSVHAAGSLFDIPRFVNVDDTT